MLAPRSWRFFPLFSSTVYDPFWVKCYIWNEIKVKGHFSPKRISNCSSTIWLKKDPFPTDFLWLLCQNSIHCLHVYLFLDSLFCCTDLHVCTYPFSFGVSTFCGVRKGNNWSPKNSNSFPSLQVLLLFFFFKHLAQNSLQSQNC